MPFLLLGTLHLAVVYGEDILQILTITIKHVYIIKCFIGTHADCLLRRRIDDDMGRTHELEHSAIKCMRGIMYCYMRQSDKVGHSVTP